MNFNLKNFRHSYRISQKEIGEVIGLSQSEVSRKEKLGIEFPTPMLEKLISKYGRENVSPFFDEDFLFSVDYIHVRNAIASRPSARPDMAMRSITTDTQEGEDDLGQKFMETLWNMVEQQRVIIECLRETISQQSKMIASLQREE